MMIVRLLEVLEYFGDYKGDLIQVMISKYQ